MERVFSIDDMPWADLKGLPGARGFEFKALTDDAYTKAYSCELVRLDPGDHSVPHIEPWSHLETPEEKPPMKMSVGVLDHYNVSTRKLNETVRFYEDVLGFMNGPRPPFDFPGAWLYSAGHPVLHLNDISTDKQQHPRLGRHRSCRIRLPRLPSDEATPYRQGCAPSRQPGA